MKKYYLLIKLSISKSNPNYQVSSIRNNNKKKIQNLFMNNFKIVKLMILNMMFQTIHLSKCQLI